MRSGDRVIVELRLSMVDKAEHIAWAAEAVAVFQKQCRTGNEHAIADLICDLGHLAEERGFDFLSEAKRGIGHWYAEHHAPGADRLGPDAVVTIVID
jgi:hypothetical protein